MQTYVAGNAVRVRIPYADVSGNAITPISATYSVFDADGQFVVAPTALTVNPGDLQATVDVGSASNQLDAGEVRDLRSVVVSYVYDGNTYSASTEYVIEAQDSLVVMANSFQTYPRALLGARELTGLEAFEAADRSSRIAALSNGYHSLTKLSYFVDGTTYADIGRLTEAEFDLLPERFRRAIGLAQIVEANELLNPDSLHKRRQAGMLSETIGESSMFFRPEKVLLIPVTRRSLDLLRGYVTWELRVGRA